MANILPTHKRVAILRSLVEGNSIRATSRIVGCSKNTVTKLLVEAGGACAAYQDANLRELPCRHVKVHEIWSFASMRQKTADRKGRGGEWGIRDAWTFTAIDSETKVVPSFIIGPRDSGTATEFLQDVASRLSSRIQLSKDEHGMYLEAAEDAFGAGIDYAMIVKEYGDDPELQKRYSPARVLSVEKKYIQGTSSELQKVSTPIVESQSLKVPMSMRRFSRLPNAFSKKIENLFYTVALHFMAYNFIKPHGTLTKNAEDTPATPAMAAAVTDRPMTYEQIVELLG